MGGYMKIEEKSRALFMKYALPCAGTLVKRGIITQETLDNLLHIVKNNKEIPEGAEKIPAVAFAACSLIAMDKGKKEIDEAVIHDYFLFNHDDMIDKRYEEMGDFDPVACRTRVGSVLSTELEKASVLTDLGPKDFRTDFCDVHENDNVVTHWDFIVEKIDRELAEKVRHAKEVMK